MVASVWTGALAKLQANVYIGDQRVGRQSKPTYLYAGLKPLARFPLFPKNPQPLRLLGVFLFRADIGVVGLGLAGVG